MTKILFAVFTITFVMSAARAQNATSTDVEKITATCYFKDDSHKSLELSAYAPSENQDIDHAVATIYATDPKSGKKLQLLATYSLVSDTPKDNFSMIFRFSNQGQKVALLLVEADGETGMSTLTEKGKQYKLNCDLE